MILGFWDNGNFTFDDNQQDASDGSNTEATILARLIGAGVVTIQFLLLKIEQYEHSRVPMQQLYDYCISRFFHPDAWVCPFCGETGTCGFIGSYHRGLILVPEMEGPQPSNGSIRIRRICCHNCGHTHAVLPDWIIPYRQYSLLFVLCVLRDYYRRTSDPEYHTVGAVCGKYGISEQLLYQWIHDLEENRSRFLLAIQRVETTLKDFLQKAIDEASFLETFYLATPKEARRAFLQTHRTYFEYHTFHKICAYMLEDPPDSWSTAPSNPI